MMTTNATTAAETITERVRARYAHAAHRAQTGARSCCASGCCSSTGDDPVTDNLYDAEQTAGLPEEAVLASLGCGNPTALIDLKPGETVLDLGSGGGLLTEAGFEGVSVEITRRYTAVEAGLDPATLPAEWVGGDGKLASAFVRATKPRSAVPASPHPRDTSRPVPVGSSDRGCCDSTCCT